MEVIMLDIDGVLNNNHTTEKGFNGMIFVSDELIKNLKQIVDKTDAQIVLSSSWRNDKTALLDLENKLKEYDLSIIDCTSSNLNKKMSILDWIDKNSDKIDSLLIIDDDFQLNDRYLSKFFLQTSNGIGLSEKNIVEAVNILLKDDFKESFNYDSNKIINLTEPILEDITKEEALNLIKDNPKNYEYFTENLKKNIDICITAVSIDARISLHMDVDTLSNKEIIFKAVKNNGAIYTSIIKKFIKEGKEDIVNELIDDYDLILEAIKGIPSIYKGRYNALSLASDRLKDNNDIILEGTKYDYNILKYASDRIKSDREVLLNISENNCGEKFFNYINEELQNDRDFCLQIIQKSPLSFYSLKEEFKNDRDFCLQAVKQNGYVLKYMNDEYKNDREIVLEAVKTCKTTLQYVNNELKNDKEIVLEAIKNNYINYIFLNSKPIERRLRHKQTELNLSNDRELAMESMKQNINTFNYLPNELKYNEEFISEYISELDNPIKLVLDKDINKDEVFKQILFKEILNHLEKTDFSENFNIDELKKLNTDELGEFFKARYKENIEIKLLETTKKIELNE